MAYVYRCKQCGEVPETETSRCNANGCAAFGPARYTSNGDVGSGHSLQMACGHGFSSRRRLPTRCEQCDGDVLAWFDEAKNSWVHESLAPKSDARFDKLDLERSPETNALVWVQGEFDGLLSGPGEAVHLSGGATQINSYDLLLESGALRDAVIVDAPRLTVEPSERAPYRQDIVPMRRNRGREVWIHFRDATHTAGQSVRARLVDLRLHHWVTGVANGGRLAREGGRVKTPIDSPEAYACFELVKDPVTAEIDPEPLRKVVTGDTEATDDTEVTGNTTTSPPQSGCAVCSLWLALPALSGVYYLTNLQLAGVDAAVWAVMCLMAYTASSLGWPQTSPESPYLKFSPLILVFLTLSGLIGFVWQAYFANCGKTPWWPLALPALAFAISPWFGRCGLRFLLMLIFQLTLLAWYFMPQQGCQSPPGTPYHALSQFTDRMLQSVEDPQSEAVSQTTRQSTENARVTLQDLIANPKEADDCHHSIYIPNSRWFALDSAELNAQVEPSLRQMGEALRKLPNRRFVITGHTDSLGDEGHNRLLSLERAKSMSRWLTTHQYVAANQLTVRGLGSTQPISLAPGFAEYNRRVEISTVCKEDQIKAGSMY